MASRTLASRSYGPIASSSRTFASTSTAFAGSGTGAKSKTAVPAQRKKTVLTIRKDGGRTSGGGGGGGGGAKLAKLAKLDYEMAANPPNLSDMTPLHPENLREENIGRPTVFPQRTLDSAKPFGLPRGLDKELTTHGPPASVVREVTVGMRHMLQQASSNSSTDARYLLAGHRGSGKSFLLLQTVCQALATGWIVLYVPRAFQWINSSYSYEYDATSQTYHQPSLALEVLQSLLSVNRTHLAKIPGPEGRASLAEYMQSIRKEEQAIKGLETTMICLAEQKEVPVLLAFDDAHTLFMRSKYHSPTYKPLEAYSLSMPLLMLDYISGRKVLNRGMTIAAPSYSNTDFYPTATFEHALELSSDRHLNAYDKLNPTHYAHASSGIKKIEVPFGMTTKEAAGMFEIWSRKGIVRRSTDETFMGTYAAAAGNPKEMRRGVYYSIQAYNHSPAGLH